jgi:hypothetical protein
MSINVTQAYEGSNSGGSKVHLNCIFNSSPLNWEGVKVDSIQQNSYGSFNIESTMDLKTILGTLRNSNPKQRFCSKSGCHILDDEFFKDEESKLINKPDSDVWSIQDNGSGSYTISLA